MKPIAVLQHVANDGPAHFAAYLDARGLPWRLFAAYQGHVLPPSIAGYGGFAILGGPMSANDPLPYLRHAERLVREAIAGDIPVIGHCLGGQLMARALGAEVVRAASPEIGWTELEACNPAAARRWFGGAERFTQFQWHHEAFTLPTGAQWLSTSACCRFQAFAVNDRHLAMQFHTEVDVAKVRDWIGPAGQAEIASVRNFNGVQSVERIEQDIVAQAAASRRIAEAIYDAWCLGLAR
jgi:GMP synthase (glutamine-hydrolysing)